ncbi:MAG TPA: response regulator transcription factor [Thermomicrobiales bacterium]|nr:response regulator transcription factor [Thermomicrobiales bacterium]
MKTGIAAGYLNGTGEERQRVLVVDDEEAITELVSTALRFVGFDVRTAANGRQALADAAHFMPHLIVLDVMMPGMDGFEVCQRLRESGDGVPVIFLTARDDQDDKLRGFTNGGDDYVTKPFSLEELVARIHAVLRRTRASSALASGRHRYADLELDEEAHRVWRGGRLVHLSPTEFRLLRYLLVNAERVVSKYQILDHVWQYDFDGDANVVETYISYLRKKIDDREPKLIQTVRGVGYSLRIDEG